MGEACYRLFESGLKSSSVIYFTQMRENLMSNDTKDKSISDIESILHSNLNELGRRLLQEHIDSRGNGNVGNAIISDGKKLQNKKNRKRNLESMFGEVEVKRIGYSAPGKSSIFPKDEQMELPKKKYSYPLMQKVSREAVRSSYDEAKATISEYTGAKVPKRQCIEIVRESSQDFESFYKQKSGKDSDKKILVTTADGKGIPMRVDGLREETRKKALSQKNSKKLSKGEKKNRKREAIVTSVYNIDPQVRTVDDVMIEFNREKSSANVKPEEKRVWASIEKEKRMAFGEVLEEGLKRNPLNKTVVFLCDGARTLKKHAKEVLEVGFTGICKDFIVIVDLIHVIGYLWKATHVFNKEGSREAEEWVSRHLRMILEGKASIVAGIMRRTATRNEISGKKLETIDKAADYFINNKSYMQYSHYLSLGLPIATGVIEGACRHLVQDRFEVSGAHWGLDGGEALLKLRSIYQSGDWDEYWEFHINQDQKRVHPKNSWKPCENRKVSKPKFRVIDGGKN